MSKKLHRQLLAAAAAGIAFAFALIPSAAYAQTSGATDVTISLPDMVILHYFSAVNVTVDADSLEGHLAYTDGDTVDETTGTGTTTSLTTDLAITPTAATGDPSEVNLVLQNAWAVRALGGADSSIEISIANTTSTLTNTNGGSLSVSAAGVQVDGGGFDTTKTFVPTGLVTPKKGDVQLTLDLTNSTRSGDYVGGVYTITVTNL